MVFQVAAISPGLVQALRRTRWLLCLVALRRLRACFSHRRVCVCVGVCEGDRTPSSSFHDPAITPSLLPKLFSLPFLFFAPMFSLAVVVYLLGCSVPSPAHCRDVIAGGPGRIFSLFFFVREVPEKGG